MSKFISVLLFSVLVLSSPFINGQAGAGARQRNNVVLAAGNPPLTEDTVHDLTDLFEWALNGQFSPEQRATLVQVLVMEWQSGDQSAIGDTLKLARLGAGLHDLTVAQRQEIQPKVQSMLLSAINDNPEDPVSVLLVSIFQSNRRETPGSLASADESNKTALDHAE